VLNRKVNVDTVINSVGPSGGGMVWGVERGNKFFELANHLGNVLATVSDRKIGVANASGVITSWTAQVLDAQDYAPFGMVMPGRKFSANIIYGGANAPQRYRYGFNGMERDDDVNGQGNAYTAMFWEYDPRIGRRWNVDPIVKFWESPYACFGNNPIIYTDPLGLDKKKGKKDDSKVGDVKQDKKNNTTFTWKKTKDGWESGGDATGELKPVYVKHRKSRPLVGFYIPHINEGQSKWNDEMFARIRDGQPLSRAGDPAWLAEQRSFHISNYKANLESRSAQAAVVGIMGAPLVAVSVPEIFVATMSTRLVSVGGDAVVQYGTNIPDYGFGLDNLKQMNITSLGASFFTPEYAFASAFIGEGFAYSYDGRYLGFSPNKSNMQNINVLVNVGIGYGGNLIGNHFTNQLKNPETMLSIFKGNLMGNVHGNLVQLIKDEIVRLKASK
jgi:RHS repeat-associated protein